MTKIEEKTITEKKFKDLFYINSAKENNKYHITISLDNEHQVCFDKIRNKITFYEKGDLSQHYNYNAPVGTIAMIEIFETSEYNKLIDYLIKKGESYRLERS